jgi:hypothetical protein
VYVFTRSGTAWTKTAKITPPAGSDTSFGSSVALNDAGTRLLVGAPGATGSLRGSAAFFFAAGSGWTLQSQFTGAASGAQFGLSVDLSGNGTRAVVGSPSRSEVTTYVPSGGTWVPQSTIAQPGGGTTGKFGRAVSLSGTGSVLLVGAPRIVKIGNTDMGGAAYLYPSVGGAPVALFRAVGVGAATNFGFGESVAVAPDGLSAVIGAPSANSAGQANSAATGTVFQTKLTAGIWTSPTAISFGGLAGDKIGLSVALAPLGRVATGAIFRTVNGSTQSGAAFIFDVI